MLPFTTTDLLFAVVGVSALLVLSAVVYALARLQEPAGRTLARIPSELESAPAPAVSHSAPQGAVQHA